MSAALSPTGACHAVNPPSIVRLAPITNPASALARDATIDAISSPLPWRDNAINFFNIAVLWNGFPTVPQQRVALLFPNALKSQVQDLSSKSL